MAQATTQSAFLLRDGFPSYGRPPLTPAFGAVPVGTRPNTSVAYFDPDQVAPISYQSRPMPPLSGAAGLRLRPQVLTAT